MSVLLTGIRWNTYEQLLCDTEGDNNPRFAYDRGKLEIMSPLLPQHETRNRILARIVEVIADECGVDFVGIGSTTLRRESAERGIEPDSAFYIRSVDRLPPDLEDLDPRTLPPPDLAIEVDQTNPSLDKLPIYAGLGVGELWHDDGNMVRIYRREGDTLQLAYDSAAFPGLTGEILTHLVQLHRTVRSLEWRNQLREITANLPRNQENNGR